MYGGNYDAYEAQRRADDEAARRDLAHARKELRRTERAAQASRERQERRSARGHRDRLSGGVPKVIKNARYTPPGATRPALDGVSLTLRGPERVAVTGPNGSGKTTLLRLAMGAVKPDVGTVTPGVDPASVAYLDQRAEILDADATVLECFRASNPELDLTRARYALALYLFAGEAALARVRSLSGGERIRAALACTVGASRPPQLLLLDEPTNHLDLDSIRSVESVIRAYDGALIVVSHDVAFLDTIGVEREVTLEGAPL